MLLRPGNQRDAALDQFLIAARQLPAPVDALSAADVEGHLLDRVGSRLEIVEAGSGGNRVAIGRMGGDVPDTLAVQIDRASIPQRQEVFGARFHGGQFGGSGLVYRQLQPPSLNAARREPWGSTASPLWLIRSDLSGIANRRGYRNPA
jgi:hypothetical protein